jgi:hypothetical protein
MNKRRTKPNDLATCQDNSQQGSLDTATLQNSWQQTNGESPRGKALGPF